MTGFIFRNITLQSIENKLKEGKRWEEGRSVKCEQEGWDGEEGSISLEGESFHKQKCYLGERWQGFKSKNYSGKD